MSDLAFQNSTGAHHRVFIIMMMRAVPLLRRRGGWLQKGGENKAGDRHHIISSRSGQTTGHISTDDLLLLFASVCADVAPLLDIFMIEMPSNCALRKSALGPV